MTPPPAWTPDELRDNPHARADKAAKVRDMFTAIAKSYDLNNRLHSFGQDQRWRRTAVKLAELKQTDRVLDVACGTGDLALAMEEGLFSNDDSAGGWPPATHQVVGLDFTYAMLPPAQVKNRAAANGKTSVAWINGDALALPFADRTFDVVSIAFGLRNVADPAAAVREFRRVLRPGGRLVILEFSEPGNPLVRFGSRLYTERIMPLTATWIARDRSGAYKYLPRSVATFLDRQGVWALVQDAGLKARCVKSVNFGVATIYVSIREW